ncbi:MAG: sensor histidine kinase [Lachnospiraceae bacterium]|nr:sensor histidine kinase [Lachnospiraceae bacterium]
MTVYEFFSDHIRKLLLTVGFALVMALFLLVTGTQPGVVVIIGIFGLLVFSAGLAADFFRCRSRLRELEEIMEGLDKKYLFAECVGMGGSAYERRLFELSRRAGRAMISAVSDAEASCREYREYVESFVHEVKTPITAAGLICQKLDAENRRKLSCELAKIGAHVERVLFYARSESTEKDFMVRAEDLGELVARAVGEHRALLIGSGIRVEVDGMGHTVFTDRKWTVFLLGQLLQNAARYHGKEPVVMISAEEGSTDVSKNSGNIQGTALQESGNGKGGSFVRLIVRDNGIGIPAHELPRVFDRGFTGSNGRVRGGSTGMGLYLCRKLADSLGIALGIDSKLGVGTTVSLTFPVRKQDLDGRSLSKL